MTARPRSRSRSSSRVSSRTRRAAAANASNSTPVVIGGVVLGLVVMLIVFAMGNDGNAQTTDDAPAARVPAAAKPAAAATPVTGGTPRTGSSPDRPAPTIDMAVLEAGDDLYREAADIWNRGQDARKNGSTADYQDALRDSWDVFEKLYASISDYTDWFEEADLEGWAMPAAYDVLQKRLDKWDNLRAKVKKLKPMRRR